MTFSTASLGFYQIMREVYCSETRGKETVFSSILLISIFVGGPLWFGYGAKDKFVAGYLDADWLDLTIAVIPISIAGFIVFVCWRALFMLMIVGIKEWKSGQDWIIEVTSEGELNFERPKGTLGEPYLIKLSEISSILKETEIGTMDYSDRIRFFVISKEGQRLLFDDYIPLDVEAFFKNLVKKHPSIDYSEVET